MQDAGRERPLSAGMTVDVPGPVALSLVASGAACLVPETTREVAALEVPAARTRRKREVAA